MFNNSPGLTEGNSQGYGVLIGHLDSGIDPHHPAFKGALQSYRFYDHKGIYDPMVEAHDATGHGTVMGGLMAGRPTADWAGGLAPEAKLLVATAIESGHHIARILSALLWMLEEPVRIVNLSIGIPGWNPVFRPVIQALRQKGVLVVASIGNGGAGHFHSPGAYPEVLSVGAAGESGKALPFSGSKNESFSCEKPDVLGLSSLPSVRRGGGMFEQNTGTSGATAYVSGVAAQLMSLAPEATACQIAYALKTTALPLIPNQKHRSQTGLIQPAAAAELVKTLPVIERGNFNQVFEIFRDAGLQHQMKYLPPEHYVPAIFYVRANDSLHDFLHKTIIQEDAISYSFLHEKYNYAFVTAMKKQWESWWENEDVIMISPIV